MQSFSARAMGMSNAVWQRHANPWSVWTRFSILPLLALAIWSRAWLGWASLAPLGLVLAWTWLNPRLFGRVRDTDNWASKGVLGERVWLNRHQVPIPPHHQTVPHILVGLSAAGLPLLAWGLWELDFWLTVCGILLTALPKAWFVDRMVCLFEDVQDTHPEYREWVKTPSARD